MDQTPELSPLDQLLGHADEANPEFMAKAEAILETFGMPRSGYDGAQVATAAAAGCILVDMMAKMAVTHDLMASSTGAAIEGLVARAIEAWAALAVREASSEQNTPTPQTAGE